MSGLGEALLVPAMSEHYARPAAGGAPPLALDMISVLALIAVSIARKLRAAYSGPCMRVRRGSDNAELDIGFTAANVLDTVALLAFVGAGSGFVTTLYDQGPSGRNLTQTNPALQPIVVNAGALVVTTGASATGKPSMTLTTARTLERADACGMSGAPALTMGARFRDGGAGGFPTLGRLGVSNFTSTGGLFSFTVNSGAAPNSMYVETIGNGQTFVSGNTGDSLYYVARAAAGAQVAAYTLRTLGLDRASNGFGGSSAAVMALSNQRTAIGGGNGAAAGVYRDASGDFNVMMIFNASLSGADLTALETELAAHS